MALCCVCALLCGCDAEIDVYEEQTEDAWYFVIDVRLSTALVRRMESTAAVDKNSGRKWTVDSWLNAYFTEVADGYGLQCSFAGTYNEADSNQKRYQFNIVAPKADVRYDLSEGLTLSGVSEVKTNLFIRKIDVVRDDRFNYFVEQFEDALSRYDDGVANDMDLQTAMGIVLFGYGSYVFDPDSGNTVLQWEFPGVFEAFPAAKQLKEEYKNVLLRNFCYASRHMQVAADDVFPIRNDNKNVYYLFEKTVGDGSTTVDYAYFRADPTGWYIVAILAGLAVTGIVSAVAKRQQKQRNKQPPAKPQDDFPYDPFAEYGRTDDNNNPFEGY